MSETALERIVKQTADLNPGKHNVPAFWIHHGVLRGIRGCLTLVRGCVSAEAAEGLILADFPEASESA